ncbi:hypothetical protein KPATCC21470_1968 [Kitasatospora purpeofusca]
MRGEQSPFALNVDSYLGPTPHARGAVHQRHREALGDGTNPACAGSRPRPGSRVGTPWDQPRMRGEQDVHLKVALQPAGTNPACAGSSGAGEREPPRCRDQPRMRGEQTGNQRSWQLTLGPTPHARGAVRLGTRLRTTRGTNPACAGSSWPRCRRSGCRGDQPRMRGEQTFDPQADGKEWGPTPHARGADDQGHHQDGHGGTNPACAGSRRSTPRPTARSGDQPRMRGEQTIKAITRMAMGGPTPHARGAVADGVRQLHRVGTNPACAGSRVAELRFYPAWGRVSATSRGAGISVTLAGRLRTWPTLSNPSSPRPQADPRARARAVSRSFVGGLHGGGWLDCRAACGGKAVIEGVLPGCQGSAVLQARPCCVFGSSRGVGWSGKSESPTSHSTTVAVSRKASRTSAARVWRAGPEPPPRGV